MNANHLPLSFKIEKDSTLDVMEAVLAIARRGGLQLGALQMRSHPQADAVFLELLAPEADLLALFLTRLRNVIGVHDIAAPEQSCAYIA
jgi:acetolactate synthase regulatory subunit